MPGAFDRRATQRGGMHRRPGWHLYFFPGPLAARGESLASHRDGRGASLARRDDREYREYLREKQRSQPRGPQRGTRVGVGLGCIARRMQPGFYHGLLAFVLTSFAAVVVVAADAQSPT